MPQVSSSMNNCHTPDVLPVNWRKSAGRLLASTICAGFMGATFVGPAAAEDCFPKIRAAEARQALPRRAAPVRHRANVARVSHVKSAVRVSRPKRIAVPARPASKAVKFVESSFHLQTRPIPWVRPAGCDKHPASAIQSAPPIVERPPAELLLAELAGPPAQTETVPEDAGPTFGGGGGPGYPPGFGGGGGGGRPPVTPPGGEQPPVTPPGGEPPPVTPPEQPPILPPEVPPYWPPVGPPPDGPPQFPPPGGPPAPPPEDYPPPGPPELPPISPPEQPPVTAVPEPATWVMLIGGFFLIGQSVRSARRKRLAA